MPKEKMKAKDIVSDYLELFEGFEKIGPNSIGKRHGPICICINFLLILENSRYAPQFFFKTFCIENDQVGMWLGEDINMPNCDNGRYTISKSKHQSSIKDIYQTIITQVPLLKQENVNDYLIYEKINGSILNKKVYPSFYNFPHQAYYLLILMNIWLGQAEIAKNIYNVSLERMLCWPKSNQSSLLAGQGIEAWQTFFEPMLEDKQKLVDLIETNLKAWMLDHIKDHGLVCSGKKYELSF